MLGLTFGLPRAANDHKFDPIPTEGLLPPRLDIHEKRSRSEIEIDFRRREHAREKSQSRLLTSKHKAAR